MMSDNPFDALPPEWVRNAEQAFAEANENLNALIGAMQNDIALREAQWGRHSDAEHFVVEFNRQLMRLMTNPAAPQQFASLLVASFIRLARAPRAEDPLEALFNQPTKDEGTQ